MINDQDIQKVREASDIVSIIGERVQLQQRGREFWCCCPLHNEKTPSFKIDPSTQLWHCFGCGEGGDVFGFVMKLDNLTFPESIRKLAERAHIELEEDERGARYTSKKQRLKEAMALAAEFYHLQLMRSKDPEASQARAYLSGRDLGGLIPKEWKLGFAPGKNSLLHHLRSKGFTLEELIEANVIVKGRDGKVRDRFYDRVMFPINDISGDCIAFGGRIIGAGEPKYLNSQETPIFHKSRVLYALDKAKAAMTATGCAIVAEGYTDVIALHRAGFTNSVATLGTALTKSHIRILSRHAGKRIIYLFDGDEAGQRATERALQFIDDAITPETGKNKMDFLALSLPDGLDPAEFIEARGKEAMQEQIDGASPLITFGIERRLRNHDLSRAEGRAAALSDALSVLAPIKTSILAKDYAIQLASRLRLREQDVLEELSRLEKPRPLPEDDPDARGSALFKDAIRREEGGSQQGPSPRPRLSQAELNRLRMEREFLSLSAQHPIAALAFSEVLGSTKWHEEVHRELAEGILTALLEDLSASAAEVIAAASQGDGARTSALTAASLPEGKTAQEVLAFLAREMQIGDLEDEIADLKASLARSEDASDGDADALYIKMIETQNKLRSLT